MVVKEEFWGVRIAVYIMGLILYDCSVVVFQRGLDVWTFSFANAIPGSFFEYVCCNAVTFTDAFY